MQLFEGIKNVNMDFLKESIALMENTTFLNLIWKKLKEWNKSLNNIYNKIRDKFEAYEYVQKIHKYYENRFGKQLKKNDSTDNSGEKEVDTFKKQIRERCKELDEYENKTLFLLFMRRVNHAFDLEVRKEYKTVNDIKDNCAEIEKAIVQNEKEIQKKKTRLNWIPIINREYDKINDFSDVIKLKLKDVLSSFSMELAYKYQNFDFLSEKEQDVIITDIETFVNSLPEEQKNIIKKEINADKLSEDAIRNALVSGSLTTAFAAVVEIGGFAFYMAAVKSLASVAGMLGVTLPFGFYTGATSLIAFLSNPFIMIPLLLGVGFKYFKKSNKKVARNLITIICVHITLMSDLKLDDTIDIYSLTQN